MVDVNTTVFNKQLEELESLADGGSLYDDQQEDDEEEVQAEPSLEWRRVALEESYSRVKRAKGRPVDPNKVYEIGTLLFEPAEGKFGRVKRSVPGYLCIQFLRGGEREYGRRPDVETYLREHHRGKTAAELAVQLGLTETEVQGHLNRLGLIRVDVIPGLEANVEAAPVVGDDRRDPKAVKTRPAKAGAKDLIPGLTTDDFAAPVRMGHAHARPAVPAEVSVADEIPSAQVDLPPLPVRGKTKAPPPAAEPHDKARSAKSKHPGAASEHDQGATSVAPPGKTKPPAAGHHTSSDHLGRPVEKRSHHAKSKLPVAAVLDDLGPLPASMPPGADSPDDELGELGPPAARSHKAGKGHTRAPHDASSKVADHGKTAPPAKKGDQKTKVPAAEAHDKSSTPKRVDAKSHVPALEHADRSHLPKKAEAKSKVPHVEEHAKSSLPKKPDAKSKLPPVEEHAKSSLPKKAEAKSKLPPSDDHAKTLPPKKPEGPRKSSVPRDPESGSGTTTPTRSPDLVPPHEIDRFIAQNYLALSNKQMAERTGLSEHTVRRKLSEWGLRRTTTLPEKA